MRGAGRVRESFRELFRVKLLLLGNPMPGGIPHVGNVNVLIAVIVEIGPAAPIPAPGSSIAASVETDVKGSIAVVAIEIATGRNHWLHKGREVPFRFGIAPGASEAVAVIVRIQTLRPWSSRQSRVAFVVQQAIRRAIAGVEIGNRIVILVQSEIVHVHAEVNVEPPVTVVVGDGGMSECSLRRAAQN